MSSNYINILLGMNNELSTDVNKFTFIKKYCHPVGFFKNVQQKTVD